jgi:hypothetical protein
MRIGDFLIMMTTTFSAAATVATNHGRRERKLSLHLARNIFRRHLITIRIPTMTTRVHCVPVARKLFSSEILTCAK